MRAALTSGWTYPKVAARQSLLVVLAVSVRPIAFGKIQSSRQRKYFAAPKRAVCARRFHSEMTYVRS